MKVSKNIHSDQQGSKVERQSSDDRDSWIGGGGVWNRSGHRHAQGGTHKETPHPAVLTVDGAAGFLAEASVGFGMIEVKVAEAEEFELVYGEAQFSRDIKPPDGEGIVVWSYEGHGVVVK